MYRQLRKDCGYVVNKVYLLDVVSCLMSSYRSPTHEVDLCKDLAIRSVDIYRTYTASSMLIHGMLAHTTLPFNF